jgi:tRNA (cmo5U34)-methyltransferase
MTVGATPFSAARGSSGYAERTARVVPGLRDMHRMAGLLLAERVPDDGRVLVVGAGGGMELAALAETHPGWRFDGVDPAPDMLALARETLGPLATRVRLHEGYVDDAPAGPFDGATCLLTLHFLPREERLRTVREVHRRMKPGAPFVVAHHSFPTTDAGKARWLARNAAYSVAMGMPAGRAEQSIAVMKERLPVLSPEDDEAVLREAGFTGVELFYAAFTFRGWVAYRG